MLNDFPIVGPGWAAGSWNAAAQALARYFKIDGPTALSFSGGRTSALMLWLTIQANPVEVLREYLQVMFGNTGREDEATLRFIKACTDAWLVPLGLSMTWVEYRNDEHGFAVVDFDTASRDGEPFEALIKKRQYLPNPVTRFCTVELKIRAMHKYLRTLGWLEGDDGWDQMVGIRHDEQRRVAKMRARGHSTESRKEHMRIPLADAGLDVGHVTQFWDEQPFNLELPTVNGRTLEGNCDLCFLKPAAQVQSLIAAKPSRGVWWARMETEVASGFNSRVGPQPVFLWVYDEEKDDEVQVAVMGPDGVTQLMAPPSMSGAVFRSDRASYSQMIEYITKQVDMFAAEPPLSVVLGADGRRLPSTLPPEEGMACFCGD